MNEKAALITGGGSGIGAGIAKTLAKHGAKVALVGRKIETLDAVAVDIENAGGRASTHSCDVRDYAALEAAIDDAASKHGRLDVLVNRVAVHSHH